MPLFTSGGFGLGLVILVLVLVFVSSGLGLGLKNLVLFTSVIFGIPLNFESFRGSFSAVGRTNVSKFRHLLPLQPNKLSIGSG